MFIISINYNYEEERDPMVYPKVCTQKSTNRNTLQLQNAKVK